MKFVYSAGGNSREFRHLISLQFPGEEVLLVDDDPDAGDIVYDEALAHPQRGESAFIVGFADPGLRRRKTEQVLADGFPLFSVKAANAVVSDQAIVGEGGMIAEFCYIPPDIRVGRCLLSNRYSYLSHDSILGDFVTLSPRVSLSGRVEVEDEVFFGTGATVLPGKLGRPIRIGKGAVIGAHALVTGDVPPGATMIGAPAKPLER